MRFNLIYCKNIQVDSLHSVGKLWVPLTILLLVTYVQEHTHSPFDCSVCHEDTDICLTHTGCRGQGSPGRCYTVSCTTHGRRRRPSGRICGSGSSLRRSEDTTLRAPGARWRHGTHTGLLRLPREGERQTSLNRIQIFGTKNNISD